VSLLKLPAYLLTRSTLLHDSFAVKFICQERGPINRQDAKNAKRLSADYTDHTDSRRTRNTKASEQGVG